jgi:molybdate transport system regulatory protein
MKAKEIREMVRLRVRLAPGIDFGPGKADLLDGIRETGSISAAGRRMKMSYKRAWQLVGELNGLFDAPLVSASKGGSGGGGAALTRLGENVLERYRRMHEACCAAIAKDLDFLHAHRSSAAE